MAKYIIDIPNELAEATARYWNETTDMTLVPYAEPDRKAIEDGVWELARIVTSMNMQDYMQCFVEDAALVMTYQEAKTKYDAWKKSKEEIRVGDEVRCMDRVGIVVRIDSMDGGCNVVWEDGATAYIGIKDLTKTDRHFSEVDELLKKMRGEQE